MNQVLMLVRRLKRAFSQPFTESQEELHSYSVPGCALPIVEVGELSEVAERGYGLKLVKYVALSELIIISFLAIASDRELAAQKNVGDKRGKYAVAVLPTPVLTRLIFNLY